MLGETTYPISENELFASTNISSVPTRRHPKMPCSKCRQPGHNAPTCKVIVKPEIIIKNCRACSGNHDLHDCPVVVKAEADRIAKEKAEAEADARLKKAAEEATKAQKKKSEDDNSSQSSRKIARDPVLDFIFTRLVDTRCTMEWAMLTNHYTEHPEMFRTLGYLHESRGDVQPHLSFEVSYEIVRPGRTVAVGRKYHLYYTTDMFGKMKYEFVTQVDRDGKPYVLASWDRK